MSDEKRNILPKDSVISLRRIVNESKKGVSEKFTILSTTDENDRYPTTKTGGSAICYEAMDSNGVCGRLKEFYPDYENQGYRLVRLGNHQLTLEHGDLYGDAFKKDCDELITTYQMIEMIRNPDITDLNNYMPSGIELYMGDNPFDDSCTSVYIWTKNDKKIITFDKYLEVVKEDVSKGRNAEAHLLNILYSVYTLSKCIKTLHSEHMYHLDIKPANFGICLDNDDNADAGNISLFDLNSVRYWDSKSPVRSLGTPGFRPKELTPGNTIIPNYRTDIYEIGATLYHALMCINATHLYADDTNYINLPKIIAKSELLHATDLTSDTKLFDCLLEILQNCLNPDYKNRYPDTACEGLIEDLEGAINILSPDTRKAKNKELGKKLQVKSEFIDIEEKLNESIKTGASGAIQRLLLNKPLYNYTDSNGELNILVLGAGTYAQKFIDIAFEVSQIRNCRLTITAVSNECKKDKDRFLNARPAFGKFFTVDDEVIPEKDSYGTLLFKSTATSKNSKRLFSKDDTQINKSIVTDLLLNDQSTNFSYVFIALGDDELNRKVAAECLENSLLLEQKALISFVQYKKHNQKCYEFCKSNDDVVPVMVNEVITKSSDYKELRRMAFNCHILWDNTLSIDIQKAKGKFSSPYNFNSSFSNVLSIKYKLHSIGIDINSYSPAELREAAEKFYHKLNNIIDFNELAMYEHRRWVCNSICIGWDTMEDFTSLKSSNKDKKNKLHPCIVKSDCEWRLNSPQWPHRKWNDDKSLNSDLDDLDRMSLKLHQHFLNEAKKVDKSAIFEYIEKISSYLYKYHNVLIIWESLVSSLTGILNNSNNHIWIYDFYRSRFLKSLDSLPSTLKKDIEDVLKYIDERLFPVLESKKYVDYKAKDQHLVKNIPFILTYSTSIKLCIPFGVEGNGETNNRVLFNNIAAPLYINPSVITYVADTDDFSDDIKRFEKALKYAVRTLDERRMQAKIELFFLRNNAVNLPKDLQNRIKEISGRIGNIEVIDYNNDIDLKARLDAIFKDKKCFTAIEKNSTGVSKLLRGFGQYIGLPAYSLNDKNNEGKFNADDKCEYFNYIQFDEHLRVAEMFATQKISGGTHPPEVPDYEDFWSLYKSSNTNDNFKTEKSWKALCKVLKEQAESDDLLGSIEIPKEQVVVEKRTLKVPSVCYSGIKKILQMIAETNPLVIGSNPTIKHITSQVCEIKVNCDENTLKALEKILSNPYLLCNSDKLRLHKRNTDNKNYIFIYFNNLIVNSLSIDKLDSALPKQKGRLLEILEKLYSTNKIICFDINEEKNTVSFCYASPQFKEIMISEGKILELYVYYKALEENYFDDIVCSYEVSDEDNIKNEFDLILTKGFKTMIVECKACTTLEQGYYLKLAQLNQQYGINSVPVLVADTLEKPHWTNSEVNNTHRIRGNKYNIKTIYSYNDIVNIGQVLKDIMKNL